MPLQVLIWSSSLLLLIVLGRLCGRLCSETRARSPTIPFDLFKAMPLRLFAALLSVSTDLFVSGARVAQPRVPLQIVNERWLPINSWELRSIRCPNEHDDDGNCLCGGGQRCRTDGHWGNGSSPLEVAYSDSCPVAGTHPGPPTRSPNRYHVNCQSCVCFDITSEELEVPGMQADDREANIGAPHGLPLLPELTSEAAERAIDALLPHVDHASEAEKRLAISMRGHLTDQISCPITQVPMRDPVVIADGNTYERSAIKQWFDNRGSGSQPLTSPVNGGIPLPNDSMVPNLAVRKTIQLLLEHANPSPN